MPGLWRLLVLLGLLRGAQAGCTLDQDLGCWVDMEHPRTLLGPSIQCLPNKPKPPSCKSQTPSECAQWCHDQGMGVAGTENGNQCFCDTAANWANAKGKGRTAAPATECHHPCAGDREIPCGGRFRISVFNFTCSGPPAPAPPPPPLPPSPPSPPSPAAGVYPAAQPCASLPLKGSSVCDPTVPLAQRVEALIRMLPEDELWAMYSDRSPGSTKLNIPFYNWWSEALHGVSRCPYQTKASANTFGKCCAVGLDGVSKCPTSFPAAITSSASFNRTLFRQIGSAIGTEARVMSNVGIASLTFWTPNVNIFRDPRWGRGQETPGEDPTLNADYAEEFVSGFQLGDDDSVHLKASSCCKHYVGYSLESWSPKGSQDRRPMTRHKFNAIIAEQDLADTYFPPFISCANRGNASGMMCSYNEVNGVPSCASQDLLNGNLRNKWGFDGYVTSDCGAVGNVQNQHNYTHNDNATCAATLGAGMDSDCGGFFGLQNGRLDKAIQGGEVTKAMRESALGHLLRVQMRLGMFDPDDGQPFRKYQTDRVDTAAHRALALSAARQGMTLVKNANDVLPLSASTITSVAAVGPHANATDALQSNYHGTAPYLVSPAEGLARFVSNVSIELGCAIGQCKSCRKAATSAFEEHAELLDSSSGRQPSIPRAVALAAAADATVILIGLDSSVEGEQRDRYGIDLPGNQTELVLAASEAAKGPCILVFVGGGCVDMSAFKASPHIDAILIAGYPGQEGGNAIAQTLFGENNPAGRLTQTWYASSFIAECSMEDMNMRPNATTGCRGRTHRFFTGVPVFKFGEGMSYTSFEYDNPVVVRYATKELAEPAVDEYDEGSMPTRSLSLQAINSQIASYNYQPHLAPPVLKLRTSVKNTGRLHGDEVVMLYVMPPAKLGAPRQNLRNYRRLHLRAGESATVEFDVTSHDLAFARADGEMSSVAGKWQIRVGSASPVVLQMNE